MANGDDSLVHLFHTIWSAGLTLLGAAFMGIVKWNWSRLTKELDGKLDKSSFDDLREDLSHRWEQQDKMHAENRQRLDRIVDGLGKLSRRR